MNIVTHLPAKETHFFLRSWWTLKLKESKNLTALFLSVKKHNSRWMLMSLFVAWMCECMTFLDCTKLLNVLHLLRRSLKENTGWWEIKHGSVSFRPNAGWVMFQRHRGKVRSALAVRATKQRFNDTQKRVKESTKPEHLKIFSFFLRQLLNYQLKTEIILRDNRAESTSHSPRLSSYLFSRENEKWRLPQNMCSVWYNHGI